MQKKTDWRYVIASAITLASLTVSSLAAAEPAAVPAQRPNDLTETPSVEGPGSTTTTKVNEENAKPQPWRKLFNGRDLTDWKVTNFGGEGEVEVKDNAIVMHMGQSLTGVTWSPGEGSAPLPKVNYEIQLEARRTVGNDFFCGLTFPYKDTHASLVLGGWGGGVIGISCIDHYDASENDTTTYQKFELNRWYKIRLVVKDGRWKAWIDDEEIIDVDVSKCDIDVRAEVELCKPLGLASFSTTAENRNIRIRNLP